jgi:hypothetical protein
MHSAAYSPELIPFEAMFSQLKACLKRPFVECNDCWYECCSRVNYTASRSEFFQSYNTCPFGLESSLSGKFRDFQLCLAIDAAGVLKALDFM